MQTEINFFIIAPAPKGVGALLILWDFFRKEGGRTSLYSRLPSVFCLIMKAFLRSAQTYRLTASCSFSPPRLWISSFSASIRASSWETIFAHSTSSLRMCSGAFPSNL